MDAKSQLDAMRQKALLGGGEAQIEKQHAKGKKTARERIEQLLDKDTFCETDMFVTHRAVGLGMEKNHPLTDGVVTGWGKIDGRTVYVFAQDFTILGGSLGEAHGRKIAKLMDLAYPERRSADRAERFGRRAHPGRRRFAGCLWGDFLPQHARFRRDPADFGHPGPLRGRGGLFARHHRFRLHDREELVHVHHRPGSDPRGDP